jgi:signal transduction histidine kinase
MTGARASSIRRRIIQLVVLAVLAVGGLCASLIWNLQRSVDANAWVEHTEQVLRKVSEYAELVSRTDAAKRAYIVTGDTAFLDQFDGMRAEHRRRLEGLTRLTADNPVQQANLPRLGEAAERKLTLSRSAIAMAQAGESEAALHGLSSAAVRSAEDEFQSRRKVVADVEYDLLASRRAVADRESRDILGTVMVGGLLAVGLLILAAIRTIQRIDRPLGSLLAGIGALGTGDLGRRVEVTADDEIGRVAQAFNAMADHLLEEKRARERSEAKLARSMAELERSNQELDGFAYVASHDLKAPLRGIRSLAEWITEDVKATASADTMENLSLLHTRVERLDMLLDSLLQYSRVGRIGGEPEEVDTADLIAEIAGYLAPKPGFSVACEGPLPRLVTNKAPLELVLRNLISNALKHHDAEAGAVRVSGRDQGDKVEIQVADDGPGIPPAFHDRVFQMFQTLKPRDQIEGSGMGLAIVRKSVENHGGAIRVESSPDRRGSTFVFTWSKVPRELADGVSPRAPAG